MKYLYSFLLILWAGLTWAQAPTDTFWHFNSFNKKGNAGISLNEAMILVKDKAAKEIVVAVIDAGVDVNHPDLQGRLWINEGEIPDNGIDDDENGYIDDINGWSFIGSEKGSVGYDNMELTRQYVLLKSKYDALSENEAEDHEEYKRYLQYRELYHQKASEAKFYYEFLGQAITGMDKIEKELGSNMNAEQIKSYEGSSREESMAKLILLSSLKFKKNGFDYAKEKEEIEDGLKYYSSQYKYGYNADFDPRESLVGDNYENSEEKYYGTNDVYYGPEFSDHGTHVAGIIAANSLNDFGAKGICQSARIMALRCVPMGDERDKDVANSIIYAADNGAQIINMSFGKGYSHNTEIIRKAVAYAQSKGLLIIHAAGNESMNIDENDNFPNDFDGEFQKAWIEVGAGSWMKKPDMLAEFSNFGKKEVDIYAPGVAIYSTFPEGAYKAQDGTSMASPVVAGCAAFLWSYYPECSAEEIRTILMESASVVKKKQQIPGKKKKTRLSEISVTGGFVNLADAVKLAEKKHQAQMQ